MQLNPKKINLFLLTKLPAAFFCGVRLKYLDANQAKTNVKHRWINQNPFNSMYFAVQAMAAELSTGALVMQYIQSSGQKISMLVAENTSSFSKKATGRITFTCTDGEAISQTIQKAIVTKEGQEQWMHVVGKDEAGNEVSRFSFKWTLKVK